LITACSTRSQTGIRNAALFTVLYRSGLRISEALALHLKDIDRRQHTLTVLHGKGDKRRVVGIDPQAMILVERWLDRRQAPRGATVFCTLAGAPLDASYVRRALRRAAHRAGIEKRVHPHGLRHTHAAELAAEGVPTNEIQDHLGHTSLRTTDIYLRHIAPTVRIDRIHQREWSLEPA
jgi:site-specific recombinase XerD